MVGHWFLFEEILTKAGFAIDFHWIYSLILHPGLPSFWPILYDDARALSIQYWWRRKEENKNPRAEMDIYWKDFRKHGEISGNGKTSKEIYNVLRGVRCDYDCLALKRCWYDYCREIERDCHKKCPLCLASVPQSYVYWNNNIILDGV